MSFGTPPQSLLVALDTGSLDLWVMGSVCGRNCAGSKMFDPSASSTFATKNTPYAFEYDAGKVQGTLATDTVSLAGYQLAAQPFGVIEKKEKGVVNSPGECLAVQIAQADTQVSILFSGSGLMGMALSGRSQTGTPFWRAVAEAGKVPAPLFTLQLGRQNGSGGTLTIGVLDPEQYSGPIT